MNPCLNNGLIDTRIGHISFSLPLDFFDLFQGTWHFSIFSCLICLVCDVMIDMLLHIFQEQNEVQFQLIVGLFLSWVL